MEDSRDGPPSTARSRSPKRRGTPIVDICRKLLMTDQRSGGRWKEFGELGTSEIRELRQLRVEVKKLKQLVADLSLDGTILQSTLKKEW